MAPKKSKAASAGDDIDELFDAIGNDPAPKKSLDRKSKPTSAASKAMADQDILAELEKDLEEPSRPHTPRVREPAAKSSPSRPTAAPTQDDKPSGAVTSAAAAARKSTDSARSLRASFTPSATSSDLQESEKKGTVEQQAAPATSAAPSQGGGWWGGIFSTATAAMKQAEAAVKEIRENEETKKWADQVRGNVGGLRALGDNLRQQALPTFTNIIHTLAPPISQHERLMIHITHDFVGYPSLDPIIYEVFSRVMAQVEGGDLMVIQRGQENTSRRSHDGGAGWRDGPWWRQPDSRRDLGVIKGLVEGTKLCRAGVEAYADEYFAAHGGIELAKVRATEAASESNPVRSSDIFLAVQAIGFDADNGLFARTAAVEKEKESSAVADPTGGADELVCFALFVLDPVHEIEYSTLSQSMPARWVRWLDAANPLTPASDDEDQDLSDEFPVPEEIREIIEAGAVDPREWVTEWIEETLSLAVGVVAQRYVARRMGVGEGGVGRGKKPAEDVVQERAGEGV